MIATTLSTIRWKLTRDPSLLNAEESAIVYAILGEKLGYPSEFESEAEAKGEEESQHLAEKQDLSGKHVCLVVGHEPGGGTRNERTWNIAVAKSMKTQLEERGAKVLIYYHKTKAYTRRCNEMRAAVKKKMPKADCVILLHYNGYSDPSANGHEFQYYGTPAIAESFRDEWQKDNPDSKPRHDNGILRNRKGRGSLMLRKAPAACVLTEPFFESNPKERQRHALFPAKVAKTYTRATAKFLLA